jgi:hypothetical protein
MMSDVIYRVLQKVVKIYRVLQKVAQFKKCCRKWCKFTECCRKWRKFYKTVIVSNFRRTQYKEKVTHTRFRLFVERCLWAVRSMAPLQLLPSRRPYFWRASIQIKQSCWFMSLITIHIDLQPFRPATNANLVIYYPNVGDATRLQKASAIRDKQDCYVDTN